MFDWNENKKSLIDEVKDLIARVENADEKGRWITVKGTHVFIPDGQDEEKVVKEFFDKKFEEQAKSYTEVREKAEKQLEYTKKKLEENNNPEKHEALVAGIKDLEDKIKYYKEQEGKSEKKDDNYKREADIALTMMQQDYEKHGNEGTAKRAKELK